MKIDLVYKVGKGNEDADHFELRQSIRSAVKHFKDLGNIYIVGYKPSWLINVKHIELGDPYTHNKDGNLINKILLACYDENLSSNFLNMSDDYFFLRDMDWKYCATIYHNEKSVDVINKKKKGELPGKLTKWERRVEKTLNVLRSKGLPDKCFETHTPQPLNKILYPQILLNYDYGVEDGMCGNTLYFNTLKEESQVLPIDFIRLEHKELDIEVLKKVIGESSFLNYTVTSYNHIMNQYLKDRFPDKSIYEI